MNGQTLEAQEWHFCNSAAHNGNFVNNAGRFKGTTKLGVHAWGQPHSSSSTFYPTSIFDVLSFGRSPMEAQAKFLHFPFVFHVL